MMVEETGIMMREIGNFKRIKKHSNWRKIMKKLAMIILLFTVTFLLPACGQQEAEPVTLERSIDAIAEYLGYTDGEEFEILWNDTSEMAGADRGKSFADGELCIYEFDPKSSQYEYWTTQTDMCVDGFVIRYSFDKSLEFSDEELDYIIQKVQRIKFTESK